MDFRAVVLTVSDPRASGEAEDRAGPVAIAELPALEATLVHREMLPGDGERIRAAVREWIGRCDILITLGGTGLGPRDVTPEALAALVDRPLPGFGELMRVATAAPRPTAALWRCGAGVAGRTLVMWLSDVPKTVAECLHALAPAIREACRLLKA
jgi:molybdenum cofactor synthesis domain-containing protein